MKIFYTVMDGFVLIATFILALVGFGHQLARRVSGDIHRTTTKGNA